MTVQFHDYDERFRSYQRDESRYAGCFEKISFPSSIDELLDVIRFLTKESEPFTIQGARTGISGAAVPQGGSVVSTEKLDRMSPVCGDSTSGFYIEVECGARLTSIITTASANGLIFRPNPTELTATIGGLFASGSSGSNSYRWGKTSAHILSAEIFTPQTGTLIISRGKYFFDQSGCLLPNGGHIDIARYPGPSGTGRFTPFIGMDLLDLFAGSEGMLGVVTRMKLALFPQAHDPWGIIFFFGNQNSAVEFIKTIVSNEKACKDKQSQVSFLEFFDKKALSLINANKNNMSTLREVPNLPQNCNTAVFLELDSVDAALAEEKLMELLALYESLGGSEDGTWAGSGNHEINKFRMLRHAVPEAINAQVDLTRQSFQSAYKMCIDISAPVEKLSEYINLYEENIDESGIEGFVFGHAAENRFHINLIPKNENEQGRARALLNGWCRKVLRDGGRVFSENGIGKTKKEFFLANLPADELILLKQIKDYFDPKGLLNPDNMF